MKEKITPKESLEKTTIPLSTEVVDLSTEENRTDVMATVEGENLKELIFLKKSMDRAEGGEKLEIIGEIIGTAAEKGMASKKVFEKIGFTPDMAKVLEGLPNNTRDFDDILVVWKRENPTSR